ncbi:MAG: hypothetical protein M3077_08775 [Candidatus Dormibacteraeota bacterium]|nr:hypothetical protein [Candidatus Dormibacteraeota bacterium]
MRQNLFRTALATVTVALVVFAATSSGQRASADQRCSNQTIKGDYGALVYGSVHQPPGSPNEAGDIAGVGRSHQDGRGHLTVADVASFNGFVQDRTGTGTYTVNPDCTGEATITITGEPNPLHIHLVIVSSGEHVYFVARDPGSVIHGTLTRMSEKGANDGSGENGSN